MKNHGVGLRPAPPLAEARVTQLATASFRDKTNGHLATQFQSLRLFPPGSNRHSFDPKQKEGYRGDCFGEASLYPDNVYASMEVVKHGNERRWRS